MEFSSLLRKTDLSWWSSQSYFWWQIFFWKDSSPKPAFFSCYSSDSSSPVLPWLWWPQRLAQGLIYELIENPKHLRLIGILIFVLLISLLYQIASRVVPKLFKRWVFLFLLSFFFFGVFPFVIVLVRSEPLLSGLFAFMGYLSLPQFKLNNYLTFFLVLMIPAVFFQHTPKLFSYCLLSLF